MRTIDRNFLRLAVRISWKRDESKGVTLVRHAAVKDDLSVRSGIFGQAHGARTKPEQICAATEQMVQEMATPSHGAPQSKTSLPTDRALAVHIIVRESTQRW